MPGVAEYAASVLLSISGSVQGAIESSVVAAAQQQQSNKENPHQTS